jgi:hypothetical protein
MDRWPKPGDSVAAILEYPADVQDWLRSFVGYWPVTVPVRPSGKARGGDYALWISDSRGLKNACGEFGQSLMADIYQSWKKSPFTVARPGALIRTAMAVAAVRRSKQPAPAAAPAVEADIVADILKAKAAK